MRICRLIFICLFIAHIVAGQEEKLSEVRYHIESVGSAATGESTPFWITSNRYGVIPAEAGNIYLRPQISYKQLFGKGFYWNNHLDVIAVTPRDRNVYLQQIYTELGYKIISLRIGSKQEYMSLWNKELSTGDLIQSANARPIPEINLSIPEFAVIPFTMGRLQIKGNVAFGRFIDDDFHRGRVDRTRYNYVEKVLWHNKSFFFRFRDTRGDIPFYATFGLRHVAQWGGTSTNERLGKQPQSFTDMIRVFMGRSGGEDAGIGDQVNVLGAHHISYDFQVGYAKENWGIQAYHQHLSSDKSGLLLRNKTDGLWGLQVDLPKFPWISHVVLEYLLTKDQSGSLHFITFDHDEHPGRGGGADNYYNNDEYLTGHSHFGRSIGTPLLPSPVYNTNGSPAFLCTRVEDFHIGLKGTLSPTLSYRALFTTMKGWGKPLKPSLKVTKGCSFLIEANYKHPRLKGWNFSGSLAGDTGDMFGEKSYGFSLGISKQGIIK